ncbi:MAG: HAMP domain-containing sensor histidine kinase [Mobilitalea sp.]
MKHSIRFKITFTLTLMVVLIIFITWSINKSFLMDYYVKNKIDTLADVYGQIVKIYEKSTSRGYLTQRDTERMEQLEAKYNIEVNVINNNLAMIYPDSENLGMRERMYLYNRFQGYVFKGLNPNMQDIKVLEDTFDYGVFTVYDSQLDSSFIDLIGYFRNPTTNDIIPDDDSNVDSSDSSDDQQTDNANQNSDEYSADSKENNSPPNLNPYNNRADQRKVNSMVFIRYNLKSIEESSDIANTFLFYVGLIVMMIGTLAMFFITKQFTHPILKLSGIAKKMTDLDFNAKYDENAKDEIGELGRSINSLSDKLQTTISELKQANNELQTDIQQKIEIDEMRKEFLSNVSHELKTPISLIQGYAEGLKEVIHDDEESRDYYCEVIMDEASKMNQMVKRLLSLNELEFGSNQVNFDYFDITALIRSVLNSTDILFKQKEVQLFFNQVDPVYVWADEYLIEQVVMNYVSNALNHVKGEKIIEIKLMPGNENVRVSVINSGEPIPEEELQKLWIKFYKVDKARTREYGGNGIGLSIVKAIMNSHNRECGVINYPFGVEFWFELDTKSE